MIDIKIIEEATACNAIATPADLQKAGAVLIKLKQEYKRIEADKDALTKPINDSLKAIRAKYAPTLDELDAYIKSISKDITAYNAKIEAQRADTLSKVLDHSMDPLQAIASISSETPAQKVATADGAMTYTTTYSVNIVDAGAIPREYLDVNETRIKTAMRAGTPVPGAELISNRIPVIRK